MFEFAFLIMLFVCRLDLKFQNCNVPWSHYCLVFNRPAIFDYSVGDCRAIGGRKKGVQLFLWTFSWLHRILNNPRTQLYLYSISDNFWKNFLGFGCIFDVIIRIILVQSSISRLAGKSRPNNGENYIIFYQWGKFELSAKILSHFIKFRARK